MALVQKQLQKQSLSMTPQMRQAIKLLELSNIDLQTYLSQHIEQNPYLSLDGMESGNQLAIDDTPASQKTEEYDNVWTSQEQPMRRTGSELYESSSKGYNIDNIADQPTTLREYLSFQINADIQDPNEKMIAYVLMDDLEATGYLKSTDEQIISHLNCEESLYLSTLKKLQNFDPAGLFARSLAECLRLQLVDRDLLTPSLDSLLENLHLLERGDIGQIVKKCNTTLETLNADLKMIKTLNPKPGLEFDHTPLSAIVPDVMVYFDKSTSEWCVKLNDSTLPKVLIDQTYESRIHKHGDQKEMNRFLSTALADAHWLIKTLEQRAQNILKIATEIVSIQADFFNYGIHHLKPLVLREIAQATGVHESTVSRITNNKYLVSPRGTFELKYFFSSTIQASDNGDLLSSESVKKRIYEMIQNEPRNKPHSDDTLVKLLKSLGINVARRTVAKYRESLGIDSSYERKKQSKIADLAS